MGRGGSTGLFQRDSKGYLYYDSLRNAASYDAASGRFQLYDGIVRPWYTGYVEPDGKTVFDDRTIAFNGNFLPFNDLTGATETPRGRSPAACRMARWTCGSACPCPLTSTCPPTERSTARI